MVFCDQCNDWYYYHCVGIKGDLVLQAMQGSPEQKKILTLNLKTLYIMLIYSSVYCNFIGDLI